MLAASVSPHLGDEERGVCEAGGEGRCVRGKRRGEEEGGGKGGEEGGWEENGGSIEGGRGVDEKMHGEGRDERRGVGKKMGDQPRGGEEGG